MADRLALRARPALARRSVRGQLARLADEAGAATAGVVGLTSGDPLARTWDGEGWVEGVSCVSEPNGRYALTLHLAVELVAIEGPTRAVRERIIASADKQGLGELVGPIRIVIEEIEDASSTDDRTAGRR